MAPSRKRSKGQARKANVATRGWLTNRSTAPQDDCSHGVQQPSKGHAHGVLVKTFLDEWEKRQIKAGDNVSVLDRTAEAMRSLVAADKKCPGILDNRRNVDSVISLFVGSGVEVAKNCSTDPSMSEQAAGFAGGFAACILVLEGHTNGRMADTVPRVFETGTNEYMRRMDMLQGDSLSLVEFFKKRIQCGCLDEKYAALKSQPKTGICEHCKQRTERKRLLVCSRCYACQFCSHECRAKNWVVHKDWCRSAGHI